MTEAATSAVHQSLIDSARADRRQAGQIETTIAGMRENIARQEAQAQWLREKAAATEAVLTSLGVTMPPDVDPTPDPTAAVVIEHT